MYLDMQKAAPWAMFVTFPLTIAYHPLLQKQEI